MGLRWDDIAMGADHQALRCQSDTELKIVFPAQAGIQRRLLQCCAAVIAVSFPSTMRRAHRF